MSPFEFKDVIEFSLQANSQIGEGYGPYGYIVIVPKKGQK